MTAALRLVAPAADDAHRGGLAQRLAALLRPEFAVEVIVPKPGDAILGTPACQVPDCARPSTYDGMCNAHRVRWIKAGRPDRRAWVATTDPVTAGFRPLLPCTVAGCRFSQHRHRLCYHHSYAWRRQGRPAIDSWLATAAPLRQADGAAACAVEWCGLDAELAPPTLCRAHRARWRLHGRPSLERFLFDCTHYGQPQFDLRELKPQLRLEIQYALQCRVDERRARTTPRSIRPLLRYLAETNATSLLDHSPEYWIAAATRFGRTSTVAAFVRFAVECVLDARDGTGWDSEYDADIWRLARLGLSVSRRARLDFRPITPAWLRQLAKRWMRWRISCGLALGQVRKDMVSLTRLAQHTPALARSAGPQRLDRAAIEQYLAALAVAVPHPKTRSGDISVIAALLRTAHQHRWAPGLPADALIHTSDHPRHEATPTPRALPEFVMAQLENPANLAKLTDPRARLLIDILIGTGLRFGDASRLRVDCLVRDQQGAPYLRYRNHKMRREAMVPIDDSLAAAIQARQQQLGDQPPDTALFPRESGNPDQRLPLPAATFNVHLQQWLTDCHVVDESGTPVKVTAHQFRHTYATRLINSEVSQEVVRRLLDHTSHTMTAHYARLADATIREQWQRAQKVNIRGEPVDLPDDHAMAEAAWMKQNLAHAKITLPNGYCGLPLQKSCPHANACLTCPLFITTAEFLPQHHQQLAETRQLITTAEQAGNDRVTQMNRTVETNLLTIITTLERGTQHEDRCQQYDCCTTGCCNASR